MSPDNPSLLQFPALLVSVELKDWLWDRLDETAVTLQLAEIAGQILSRLNLPDVPQVSVQASLRDLPPAGLVALRVNGAACRYSLGTVWRAYLAASGMQPLASVADGRDLSGILLNAEPDLLARFLGYIFQEALSLQPSILLSEARLAAYQQALSTSQPPGEWLRRWLGAALDLGLMLPTPERAADLLTDWDQKNLSTACEELVAVQAPGYIELQIERQTWKDLSLGFAENGKELFPQFHEDMFVELGIEFPPIHITSPQDLLPGTFRLMVNHLPSLPHPSLKLDQAMTNAEMELLESLGIPWQPAINPRNRNPNSLVSFEALPQLQNSTTWNPLEYMVLWLSGRMRDWAYYFVNLNTAENALKRLGEMFPALESAAEEVISPRRLAAIMRLLLQEGLPVINLRQILHSLMDMDYVVAVANLIVIDDRIQVAVLPTKAWVEDPAVAVEFVRSQLKHTILDIYKKSGSNLIVYQLVSDIEDVLHNTGKLDTNSNYEALSEEQREQILDAIRRKVVLELRKDGSYPPILTTQGVRPTLRRLLAGEFPHLPVLSYQELPSDASIEVLGRISQEDYYRFDSN